MHSDVHDQPSCVATHPLTYLLQCSQRLCLCTDRRRWGYFWHVRIGWEQGTVPLSLLPSMSLDTDLNHDETKPSVFLYRPLVRARLGG